mgnify:CR=1 FL=1
MAISPGRMLFQARGPMPASEFRNLASARHPKPRNLQTVATLLHSYMHERRESRDFLTGWHYRYLAKALELNPATVRRTLARNLVRVSPGTYTLGG